MAASPYYVTNIRIVVLERKKIRVFKDVDFLHKSCLIWYSTKPIEGFLDDYAFIIRGLLDLYTACQDEKWIQWADELQQKQNELFWDSSQGGYFTSAAGDSSILIRLKEGSISFFFFAFCVVERFNTENDNCAICHHQIRTEPSRRLIRLPSATWNGWLLWLIGPTITTRPARSSASLPNACPRFRCLYQKWSPPSNSTTTHRQR